MSTTMTHTFTRTHVSVEFANPHLRCDHCQVFVESWHDNDQCGCDAVCWNVPCGHQSGVTSLCPSWGPVDGCTCSTQCAPRLSTLGKDHA